jgi:hypothetical protein
VLESDNLLSGIARGNLKTNPKAITILRDVDTSRLTDFPPDLEYTIHRRADGKADVMIVNKQNEIFEGRTIPQDPHGKLVDRPKDEHGNLVPRVGDRVVSVTPDGDYVNGTIVTFGGSGGTEKIVTPNLRAKVDPEPIKPKLLKSAKEDSPEIAAQINKYNQKKLDQYTKDVIAWKNREAAASGSTETTGKMQELWVRRDANVDAKGNPVPFQIAKEHVKYDPEKWYVDPDQISKDVDYGKIYKADKATARERAFLSEHFAAHGELPQRGTITETREQAGYNGQDFFVKHIDTDKGVALLESPRSKQLAAGGGIEVPLADLRLKETTAAQYDSKEIYDKMYESARDQLGKKPFASVIGDIANKFDIRDDAVRPLMNEIARRFKEELTASRSTNPDRVARRVQLKADVDKSIMEHEQQLISDINAAHEKMVKSANSNGMYLEDIGTGVRIRDVDSNAILHTASTPSEAIKFINESGQADGADLDVSSPVPTSQFGDVNGPPASLADPGTARALSEIVGTSRGGRLDRVRAKFQVQEAAHPWLVGMRGFIAAMDERHGTNLLPAYARAQNATLETEARVKKLYKRTEPVLKMLHKYFPTADLMTLASRSMEAMSIEDMDKKFFGERGLSTGEKQVGKFIADNNLDETRIFNYRREINEVLSKIAAHQSRDLVGSEQLRKHTNDVAAFDKTEKDARAEIASRYEPELEAIRQKYSLTKPEQELYNRFEAIANSDMSEASIYGAIRYGRALKNPGVDGLSQAAFFEKHGFSPEQQMAIAHAASTYDRLGNDFGIPQFRRINGYMNHMKRMGLEARPGDIMKFSAHIDNPGVARFMSDMYRTGENDGIFNHDLVEAIRGYIRGGVKAQVLFPEIHGQLINGKSHGGVKEQFLNELAKLPDNVQDVAYRRLREYIESLTGRMPLADAVVREGVSRSFEQLGLDTTSKPIDTGGKTASLLSLINASFTGGKIYQGLRDITDIGTKYFTKYGLARTQKFLSIAVKDMDIAGLMDKGIIRSVDKNTFSQPVESSIYGKARGAINKFEEVMFKMTLQDKVFERAQAASYYESKGLAREVFNKVLDKKMTLDDAVTALSLRQFEDGVTAEAGRLLEAYGSESAAEFYAKQSVRSTVGLFGHGEQPSGFNTKTGRLLGQYGIYPIETRRFVMDVTTRGTPKEIAAQIARYTLAQTALGVTGTALGFNMARWLSTPASMIYTGSPLLQFMGHAGMLAGSMVGGDDAAQRMAYNSFKQAFPSLEDPRSMFVPGSYYAYDLMRGFQLLQDGEAKGVAGAFGIPLSKDPGFIENGGIDAPYAVNKFVADLVAKNTF